MSYRILIAKGDSRFEAEGDKRFVMQMLAKYGALGSQAVEPSARPQTKALAPTKGQSTPASIVGGKKTSVGEFIRQLELKKHIDLVLGFGFYLERTAGLDSFTSADINNCYYEAKIERSNTSQMIIQNIKKGFMMAAKKGEKKRQAFVLTRSGEDFIAKHPPKKAS